MEAIIKTFLILLFLCAFTVHDGDTFTMDDGQTIRLYGVDAPEMNNRYKRCAEQICYNSQGNVYRCANNAKTYLYNILKNKHIVCVSHGKSYNRMVGECYADDVSVSAEMVHSGWAVEDKRYSHGKFSGIETISRLNSWGVWQGRFEMPWDYRRNCGR